VPKLRKPRTTAKADKTGTKSRSVSKAPASPAAPAGDETIACMHCGHINPLPGGVRPGRTVSCKLCARMFSVEAAAAHVPPPPPEPPPPPPSMTPHKPVSADSIDAAKAGATLIYTPPPAPPKRTSKLFRVTLTCLTLMVATAVVWGAVVMVPQMNRTRAAAKRSGCLANLHRIAGAVELYAHAHGGAFPDTLGQVMVLQNLTGETFVCPGGDQTPAPGATAADRARHLHGGTHLSYHYVGRGLNRRSGSGAGSRAVVAYESPANHGNEGVHVLFADGHVAFVHEPAASQLINDVRAGKNPPGVSGF
jgi:prepilin-type processing-associated H-X9-DG protein